MAKLTGKSSLGPALEGMKVEAGELNRRRRATTGYHRMKNQTFSRRVIPSCPVVSCHLGTGCPPTGSGRAAHSSFMRARLAAVRGGPVLAGERELLSQRQVEIGGIRNAQPMPCGEI